MFCIHCGNKLPGNAKLCIGCGNKIGSQKKVYRVFHMRRNG